MNFVQRSRDRWDAQKRIGFSSLYAGEVGPIRESIVTAVIRWKYERRGPWPWHYLIRAYRRVVLARKDWRLPWR